ncbi:tetratricopeptide repeat protein [Magnetospirillum sp. UT-4]|uniref:tetratricopeptide repeat protein n=1 Tax=Magnetospirillum sp. UT-4 TaxID=2681467 RepID=UPI0013810895|nr:tetratricopeptide repeat protein [Magnetospirillum sp. UT-4]CAA7619798.1 conserved hypothetical protein [Magnetospirillum sp. UT-4]
MSSKHDDAATDLLIREVDEDLRQERMEKLWKRYGSLFIAGAVALVLSVAGWQGFNTWQTRERQAAGAHFAEAAKLVEEGKRDAARPILAKLAADGSGGYRALAEFKLGDLAAEAGDTAAALASYDKVAAMAAGEPHGDLAVLKAAYLRLDGAEPAMVEKAVEKLAAESSPWRHSAREILALAALKRGDAAKAADWFAKVADDPAAPQGVRARAAEMLAATKG